MKKKKEYVMVETLLTYRLRYVIEKESDNNIKAINAIMRGDAMEFDQKPLDEIVLSVNPITKKDAIKEFRKSNPSFAQWSDKMIAKNHITFNNPYDNEANHPSYK